LSIITIEYFQYYEKSLLKTEGNIVYYNNRRLNVFAAVDFAFSLEKKADFTSIVVVGVDASSNYYILDIVRFKTDRIIEYFNNIMLMHKKWHFRKIRAEATSAATVLIKDLRENYIRKWGLALVIDETKPQTKKEDRIHAALSPRYENRQMFHYVGGNCEILENELVLQNPPHDDVKDSLASVIEICIPPTLEYYNNNRANAKQYVHARFGGIN